MAEHTPGPWTVDAVQSEALHDIILDYQVPGAGSPILVGFCYGDDDEPTRPGDISSQEAEANARLMAAAPELLAACEAALHYAALCTANKVTTSAESRRNAGKVFTQLQDAIAKARGPKCTDS